MTRHLVIVCVAAAICALPARASAHCDTTRGPVVTAARAALEAGDPDLVLHWVRPEDEAAIKRAFAQTVAVRGLGPEAQELADRYFFETLVRIHRAGEGAPYTGLSDEPPEPIIAATDRALERGSAEALESELISAVKTELAERFAAARAAQKYRPGDVAAGRDYVEAYVSLTHWVEGVHLAATRGVSAHDESCAHGVSGVGGHDELGASAGAHGLGERAQLPWLVAGLLAMVSLVLGALLVRRR